MTFLIAWPVSAETSIETVALFNHKAMLVINGKKAKILKVGETYQGVKLIESNTDHATVEVAGKKQILILNGAVVLSRSIAAKAPSTDRESAQLWSDASGFFRAQGSVNGEPLEFLIDTGANIVVMNSRHADRINLDYKEGQRSYASTASGTTPMYLIKLDRISFEGIQLYNIEAGVIEGSFPVVPLLGMSYLKRLDMKRAGNRMTLKKRY